MSTEKNDRVARCIAFLAQAIMYYRARQRFHAYIQHKYATQRRCDGIDGIQKFRTTGKCANGKPMLLQQKRQ